MKVLVEVALLSLVGFVFGVSDKKAIGIAISQIVENRFSKTLNNLRIVKYSGVSTEIDGIANEIVQRSVNTSLTFDIFDLKKNQLKGFELNQSAILLFDEPSSLFDFYYSSNFKATSFDTIDILAYIESGSDDLWNSSIKITSINIVFMKKEGNDLILIDFIYFNEVSCTSPIVTELNRFTKSEARWENNIFFPAKLEDFNGCELVIALPNNTGYDTIEYDNSSGIFTANGFNIELMKILSQRLNFSLKFTYFYSNNKRDFDLQLGATISPAIAKKTLFLSHIYRFSPVQFLVPPGELYTPEEKLFLPFDLPTWIGFIAVFVIAILVTFLLKISRDSLKEYFFGSNIKTPVLNLFQHFFGFGQTSLPTRNFARFILMVFILFCLIMRTAYQGKMFEFLTSDVRKKGVQTIEEMIERNLTLFVNDGLDKIIHDIDVLKRCRIKFLSAAEDLAMTYRVVQDVTFKDAMIVSKVNILAHKNSLREKFVPKVLDEEFFTIYIGMAFPPFHYFYKPFNDIILRVVESGLIDKWFKQMTKTAHKWIENHDPVVLTWDHLYVGFYICIACIALSTVVFLAEILFFRLNLKVKKYYYRSKELEEKFQIN